jgi:cell division protein FtsZ
MALLEMSPEGLKFEIQEESRAGTRFKVIGVGGGGSNAVARMMGEGLEGVEFYIVNTDLQALRASPVPNKIQIGAKLTGGLGAGADPAVGKQAALEDTERIVEVLEHTDMVFVTTGLGGGTGTGAAPVIASLAKELGALTVAVVTKPFGFEGPRRKQQAERGLGELAGTVDTVIAIPNDRLLSLLPRGTSVFDGFRAADDVLRQAVQGISDIIVTPGLINRDFSDIRATMQGMGFAMMGTAVAKGENAAVEAARQAITCPLLEEGGITGARGILINITGSAKLGLHEVNEACSLIADAAECPDVQVSFGVVQDETMGDGVKITVIATGFRRPALAVVERRQEPAAAEPSAFVPEARAPEPEPAAAYEPEPVVAPPPPPPAGPPIHDRSLEDDVDTPAYLRRNKLLF